MRYASLSLTARCFGSLLVAVGIAFIGGCGKEAAKSGGETAGHDHHDHPEEGPHHGPLIELGQEEFHGELVHDDKAHKITIYLLDSKAVKAVPILEKEVTLNVVVGDKPQQYKLPAVPQTDDPAGSTSRFELIDEKLCEALDDPKTKARLNVTIAGRPLSGDVGKHDHDHDHKH